LFLARKRSARWEDLTQSQLITKPWLVFLKAGRAATVHCSWAGDFQQKTDPLYSKVGYNAAGRETYTRYRTSLTVHHLTMTYFLTS
jgi:hypothetical protein